MTTPTPRITVEELTALLNEASRCVSFERDERITSLGRPVCDFCNLGCSDVIHFCSTPKGPWQGINSVNGMVCVKCARSAGLQIHKSYGELERGLAAAQEHARAVDQLREEANAEWRKELAARDAELAEWKRKAEEAARDAGLLQQALYFWMPSIAGIDHPAGDRAANDSQLLVGFGIKDEPSAQELGWIVVSAAVAAKGEA